MKLVSIVKKKSKYLLAFLIVFAVLLSATTYIIYILPKPVLQNPNHITATPGNITLTLPYRTGDTLTLFYVVKMSNPKENTTVILSNGSIIMTVVKPGWPFTRVRIGDRIVNIPTIMIAMPTEFIGKNVSAPIQTTLIRDKFCLPLVYKGTTIKGETYVGSTPGTCKSLITTAYYYSNGLVNMLSILALISGNIYTEEYELIAWSTSGETKINATLDEIGFCQGYYSRDVLYTLPGAYKYTYTHASIIYDISSVGKTRPLLVLAKSSENEKIWRILPERYVGTVIVVSPLLKEFWKTPYLDEVIKNGAVLVLPGNKTIVGTEEVYKYLISHQLGRS